MANTKVQLLIQTYEMAYGLVRYYNGNLKDVDPFKQWEVNGQMLNSIAWLNAHLCWSEDFLLIKCMGGQPTGIEWLKHYALGADGTMHPDNTDFKSILDTRKQIHQAALNYLNSLTDADLEKANPLAGNFGKDANNLTMFQHAIRHEGTHAGHLGWLCRINKAKTI